MDDKNAFGSSYGPKRWRYSPESMNPLTHFGVDELPLNWLSLPAEILAAKLLSGARSDSGQR